LPHSKLNTIFNGIKSTTLADVFIDRIVKVPDLDKLVTDVKAKSAVGGGSIRGIKQREIVGGNATNIAYALVKFGSETELFAIGDEFTRRLLDLRFQEFDNIKINMLKGKPGFTVALETNHNNDSNIMISDVGGIEKFNGIDITTNYLKIIEESDIVIISNWASNLNGNQLVNEIFSAAKDSIKLLDFADLSTSTNRLQELMDNIENNKIIDVISLNENECQILGKFLGLKNVSAEYTINEIKTMALDISSILGTIIDIHTPIGSCSASDGDVQFVESFPVKPIILTGAGDVWNAINILGLKKGLSTINRLNLANASAASYISEFHNGDFSLLKVENLLEARNIFVDSL
jgi:sugar/nucleoside kinase (ribokinase family)|tara:strand:- start:3984 stop:5030 length:1047 start_codon:yes stop_codon:yes gene_type:complete